MDPRINPSRLDLDRLNSATKYPSIETYHVLGERGRLREEVRAPLPDEPLVATEKVDGANCRICAFFQTHEHSRESTYLIGSREGWLTARGDLIANAEHGIVQGARPWAEMIVRAGLQPLASLYGAASFILVFFGEVYGGATLPEAKSYTATKALGFRLFDAILLMAGEVSAVLSKPTEQIASWRNNGGQKFLSEEALARLASMHGVPLVPRFEIESRPPAGVQETYEWLRYILPGPTRVALDGTPGRPEGLVLRDRARKFICKIRFEDYERTLRAQQTSQPRA